MKGRQVMALVLLGAAGLVGWACYGPTGLSCNATSSIPQGCYWVTAEAPNKGQYAVACVPVGPILYAARERGYLPEGGCPGDVGQIGKVVAAAGGDLVEVDDTGVHINGVLWPASKPQKRDSEGRPMPDAKRKQRLAADEFFLMSERSTRGFDSRYFGPVSRAHVLGTAVPILTW